MACRARAICGVILLLIGWSSAEAQPVERGTYRQLTGSVDLGWLDTEAKEFFVDERSNPFTTIRFDYRDAVVDPAFLSYRIQPFSEGFQDPFGGQTDGTGIAADVAFLPARPWPLRFYYSRFRRVALTATPNSSYTRYASQNDDSLLGVQWQLLVPSLPKLDVSFNNSAVATRPEEVLVRGYQSRSKNAALNGTDTRRGWSLSGSASFQRLAAEYLGASPTGAVVLDTTNDIRTLHVGAEQGGIDAEGLRALVPEEHREWIDTLLARNDVPALPEGGGDNAGRQIRVDPRSMAPLIDVAFAHEVKLVASALGTPPAWLVERAHAGGVPVAALAGRPDHAVAHREAGVDIVIAQGTEGGGHTGEIATMVLVPQVVDAVAPTPVLAAGGIATGRQMAAALALGGEGVWCGSVWLTTKEAETSPAVKEKFLAATSADTRRSRSLTGKPARMLRRAWTDAWEAADAPAPLGMPLQSVLVSDAQRRIQRLAHKAESGARQLATYFVGQVVGQMNEPKSTRRVVAEMIEEFAATMERMERLVRSE